MKCLLGQIYSLPNIKILPSYPILVTFTNISETQMSLSYSKKGLIRMA